ncbi:DUF2812 domain-containing protein [Pallidibacillus pasinlerensis]|uniref:DUF2812 domain-containing protein n=1 Tax=Pallidibacillus pasinlerensis TaxID=2703818 RepID=A0ABX0A612_9BACI|nr:DUF2812 domain-containing protein [Pallidibacillus pasinlerensis]NCU17946.1 DUF2812 domain-containing protein [Pallidibacillus pasinlerensis]
MKQTKKITSEGLAFFEEKDMKKLRKYSLQGWHVYDFSIRGYKLEKGESRDYIYNIDYRFLNDDEKEEYIELCAQTGWTHIASDGDLHLFRANRGTKPLYTDQGTKVEKYAQSGRTMSKVVVPFVLITVLLWIGEIFSSGIVESILFTIATILTVIALPLVWATITIFKNKWKLAGRKGLVTFVSILPILLFCVAAYVVFFVEKREGTIIFLSYMLFGAIGFSYLISLVTLIYQKVRKKAVY